MRFTLARNRVS